MQGMIVSKHGRQATVLCEDGVTRRILCMHRGIGQRISVPVRHAPRVMLRWAVCAAVLGVFAGGSVLAAYTPYAVVQLDAGTQVRYTLNRFDQIIGVSGSHPLTEELSVGAFSDLDDTLSRTVTQMDRSGYFAQDPTRALVISVGAKGGHKAEALAEHIGAYLPPHDDKGPRTEVRRMPNGMLSDAI